MLDRHLAAFTAGDVGALIDDYSDDSVLITSDATVSGRDELAAFFSQLFAGMFRPGSYSAALDVKRTHGDIAFIVWSARGGEADVPYATDTFVVRDGKIVAHTLALQVRAKDS